MSNLEYLEYSAKEPMTLLRKKFNNGEDIYKISPTTLTAEDALADVMYLKYVFENAYSGFSYYDKSLFDTAFASIVKSLKNSAQITPDQLIDVICSNLSFISDGHLALTTADYGNGFYKELQTYVSDMLVYKVRDAYYDAKTKKQVLFDDAVRAFPTLNNSIADSYLIGIRSKNPTEKISVKSDGKDEILPLHRIMSKEQTEESLVEERYEENIAIITCSSFVGDSEEAMKKLYEIGKKCRKYRHVILDLSNNLGGNSEFPKHFLKGLYGDVADTVKVLELQSSLVHAKETGEIKDIPYHFEESPHTPTKNGDLSTGELHIIINDMVASSTELALRWAASYPRVTFYGCNSLGIGHFGDLCIYYLPNSQIVLWCPQKVFDAGIQETVGFEPDFWIDSHDVVSAVLNHISVK